MNLQNTFRQRLIDLANEKLFTLRYRLSSGMVIITVWEGDSYPKNTHTRLDAELRQNGKVIFPRGKTYGGIPVHQSIDGDYAKELATSLFSIKPGDTDDEYFSNYTPEQLAWVEANGEELDMLKYDRYGEI